MLWRVFSFFSAAFIVGVTLDAGWLQSAHYRLGGVGCLVLAALFTREAFKSRRARS